ncbi:hypothetical protein IWQ54_004654 [Labrenzia sp. EL_195]|nr:hypothetical protein [Labrenzia sp. EL_195]
MKPSSRVIGSLVAFGICLLQPVFVATAANATIALPLEDARPTSVAVQVTYEFLNTDAFYECALKWLNRNDPVSCENYFNEVSSIASGVKNLQLKSIEEDAFVEVVSMYVAARDAALPHCPNWQMGDRPDICFELIISAVKEKWRNDFQKVPPGSLPTGKSPN